MKKNSFIEGAVLATLGSDKEFCIMNIIIGEDK